MVLPQPGRARAATTSSPGCEVQVEPVEGVHVAVRPAQAGQLDGDAGGGSSGARGRIMASSSLPDGAASAVEERQRRPAGAAANTMEARAAAIDSGRRPC